MFATEKRHRWTHEDRGIGPLTWARDSCYRDIGLMLFSGDEESRRAGVRFHFRHFTLIVDLPSWLIRPQKKRVEAKYWSSEEIARLGRNWYWDIHQREYGFTVSEGALHVHYGAQTMDSSTDYSKCYFLPWRRERVVRTVSIDLDGGEYGEIPVIRGQWTQEYSEARQAAEDAAPSRTWAVKDYDGEIASAIVRVYDTEYALGEGRWSWLSLFRRNRVNRRADIQFSAETGRRKGSWKGGTIGASMPIGRRDIHVDGLSRYCTDNGMEILHEIRDPR